MDLTGMPRDSSPAGSSTAREERSLSAILSRRRLLLALPAMSFASLASLFFWGLNRDPSNIPSSLIGRSVPKFRLPPVEGRSIGRSSENLYGEVSLVNVFASGCTGCRAEHPLFRDIRTKGTSRIH